MSMYTPVGWVDGVTPLDQAHFGQMDQGIEALDNGKISADAVVAAATRIVQNKLLITDGQPAFRIDGNGRIQWGPGGSGALDNDLYRVGPDWLATHSKRFTAGAAGANSVSIGDEGTGASIYFGNAFDTALYRPRAGLLRSNGAIAAGSTADPAAYTTGASMNTNGAILSVGAAGTATAFYAGIAGQTARWVLDASGQMVWYSGAGVRFANLYGGTGGVYTDEMLRAKSYITANYQTPNNEVIIGYAAGVTAGITFGPDDTRLYRNQPGGLRTDGSFIAGSTVTGPGAQSPYRIYVGGNYDRWRITGEGEMVWGDGVTGGDLTMYRYAANQLGTNGYFIASRGIIAENAVGAQVCIGRLADFMGGQPAEAGLLFGSAKTESLYRSSAGVLRSNALFIPVALGQGAGADLAISAGAITITSGLHKITSGTSLTNIWGGTQHGQMLALINGTGGAITLTQTGNTVGISAMAAGACRTFYFDGTTSFWRTG